VIARERADEAARELSAHRSLEPVAGKRLRLGEAR